MVSEKIWQVFDGWGGAFDGWGWMWFESLCSHMRDGGSFDQKCRFLKEIVGLLCVQAKFEFKKKSVTELLL
jgi:hypothetical protein